MQGKDEADAAVLTSRETQLLHYLADGLSLKECAAVMLVSHNTAKVYSHHLSKKLGVSGSRELAVWELKRRIRILELAAMKHIPSEM